MRQSLLLPTILAIAWTLPAMAELQLEVSPPNPLPTEPVTVTVSDLFANPCHEVCATDGFWVDPTQYHIDWYIFVPNVACIDVISPLSCDVALGPLSPGDYVVTAAVYITSPDGPCELGSLWGETEIMFHVSDAPPPIPAVSDWGLVITILLVLMAGTVVLRRAQVMGGLGS